MPREVWIIRDGQFMPKPAKQRGPSGPFVIPDTIDPTWHPSDGQTYDSKSAFRRVTKAHGGIEVGNERQTQRPPVDRVSKADIAQAVQMVEQGYRPAVQHENDAFD